MIHCSQGLKGRVSGCICVSVEDSDSGCHLSALRLDGMPVLCGVTRVGLVAKGLLIKGDMDLELVLMCREKPTKLLLYTISANLPLQIQVPSVTTPALLSTVPPQWALKVRDKKKKKVSFVMQTLVYREQPDAPSECLETVDSRHAENLRWSVTWWWW